MGQLEYVRHQVAIAGTVSHRGRPLAGALVEIHNGPEAWLRWRELRAEAARGRDVAPAGRFVTAADGHYHILDLPDGDYSLAVILLGSGSRYVDALVSARVVRDAQGKIDMTTADVEVVSTRLSGTVVGVDGAAVALAAIQLRGSPERTLSDVDGHYVLDPVEIGARTLVIEARGYPRSERTVQLAVAGQAYRLDIDLGAPDSFSPIQLVGCRLWLCADSLAGLPEGSPLAAWTDGSGQGFDAGQSEPSARPSYLSRAVNGQPAVRFDGESSWLELSLSEAATEHSFFFVCDLESLGEHSNYLFDAELGRLILDGAHQNPPHYLRWRDRGWRVTAPALTGPQILSWVFGADTGTVYRNGEPLGSRRYRPGAIGGRVALGSNYSGLSNTAFGGSMAEIIYFNRALSDEERGRIEAYLSRRYGLMLIGG